MAEAPPEPTRAAPVVSDRTRAGALRSLAARRSASHLWVRVARWVVPMIGVGFGALMLVVRFGTGATNLDELLGRAIGAICWVGGGLALLGLARADDAADDRDGITALVHLRGHQRSALARARRTTAGWVVMGTICPTAIGLAVLEVALARSLSDLWVAVVLGTGAAAFTAFASVILALVARAAAALNPHRPRLMAAALLLIPELVRTAGLTIPSVPSVLAAVLEQTLKLGAGAA